MTNPMQKRQQQKESQYSMWKRFADAIDAESHTQKSAVSRGRTWTGLKANVRDEIIAIIQYL